MASSSEVNFVRQQGFREAAAPSCGLHYRALVFQPRIVGVVLAAAVVLQAWYLFLPLGALLWWNAVAPEANPFDAAYNLLLAGRGGRLRLEPAPPPRRFAQGMAGSLMIAIGLALLAGATVLAWVLEAFVVAAFSALVFGKFCLGSYIFYWMRGEGEFANRTLPWSKER
jgi:hypothetical protein